MILAGINVIMIAVMLLFTVGLPILVIGGAIWLLLALTRSGQKPAVAQTPLDILRMRYAKGEITQEQFETMKRNLEA